MAFEIILDTLADLDRSNNELKRFSSRVVGRTGWEIPGDLLELKGTAETAMNTLEAGPFHLGQNIQGQGEGVSYNKAKSVVLQPTPEGFQ